MHGYAGMDVVSKILKKYNLTFEQANDNYDLVLHLITAAKEDVKSYNFETNAVRFETVDEAVRVDDNLLEAWKENKNRIIVSSGDKGFEYKLNMACEIMTNHIHNTQRNTEEKFKVLERAYNMII